MATEAQALVERPPTSEAATPVAAPPTAQQRTTDPPSGPPAGKQGKAQGKESKGKDAKGKKGKAEKAADAQGSGSGSGSPSVAGHPRAARAVSQAKGWGGLTGFLIAGYLSLPTGTLAQAGLRALIAGCVCYVAAWAGAVFVWRRLVIVEIKGREQALLAGAEAALGPSERTGAPAEPPRAGAASQRH